MEIKFNLGGGAVAAAERRANQPPYIGLRYFEEADASLFYGRDEHVTELLGKLAQNRFVAVLGSSGSGKSSLVRAGLLPELRSGMIPQAGPRWAVIEFKPGNGPLHELAAAVRRSLGVDNAAALIEEGPRGLINAVAAAGLDIGTNVLVIADQFEEVFRYQREESERGGEPEAVQQSQAMVRCLLDAVTASGVAIYILLVMRSDYLGECSQFPDLPETINQSVYLVPRLRRDQVQESITAPVGDALEPALLQELLGKAVGDPDQLPRLQHLLRRMWGFAGGRRMTRAHYKAAGGWDGALGQHLDKVYDDLDKSGRTACVRMFQRLSEVDERGRLVRRRALLKELTEVCGIEAAGLALAFQVEGFLKPGDPVDITHECVLRNWHKINVWLREETEARDFYRELKIRRGRGTLLTGSDVATANLYFVSGRYSAAWARRYGSAEDFEHAFGFARDSLQAEQKSRLRERVLGWALYGLGIAFVVAVTVAAAVQHKNAAMLAESNKALTLKSDQTATTLRAVQAFAGSKNATRSSQQDAPATDETGFTVPELAQLYDFPAELTGTGQTIGLIELGGGFVASDLKAYFAQLKIAVPETAVVSVGGATNRPGDAIDIQATADIEIAGAVAPGAHIVAYFAPNTDKGYVEALDSAIFDTQHHPSILSIGWGGPEPAWTPASIQAINQALEEARKRGITVVVAAGDNGVTDGLGGLRAVDFPASSPWVLAVGGTHMTASGNQIVSETVWNDGESGATGGGPSSLFPVPSWQQGVSIPATAKGQPGRGIPDVAANASSRTGYRAYIHGQSVVFGGTSAGAPLWAGLMALMNQGVGQNIGFLNATLYGKLARSGAFRDITQGNNSYGGVAGYSAGPGWNPCTGWGSPDGRKLLAALKNSLGQPPPAQ